MHRYGTQVRIKGDGFYGGTIGVVMSRYQSGDDQATYWVLLNPGTSFEQRLTCSASEIEEVVNVHVGPTFFSQKKK